MDEQLKSLLMEKMKKIDEIHVNLTAHTAKEEQFQKDLTADISEIKDDVKGHAHRLYKLETWRSSVLGKVAGISIGLSIATSLILWMLKLGVL